MEFGQVAPSRLSQIDFRLAPEDSRTISRLSGQRDLRRFGVGCPVWSVKAWLGKVYPRGTDPKDFLYHYSRQFNSIELNTTHYRVPDAETVTRWREQTPDGFRFSVKFLQEISHRRPLGADVKLVNEFVKAAQSLEDRLGLSFLQLPPYFSPRELPELRQFLKRLPRDFQIAIEFRHPDFFVAQKLESRTFDLLAETGAHVVITDVAGRRDVSHASVPNARAMIRFIGNDLHPTDVTRLETWIERLANWISLGMQEIEFFVHEPNDVHAPDLSARLIHSLNARAGLKLASWHEMNKGEQLGFF